MTKKHPAVESASDPCQATLLTPAGRGAIATVSVTGARAPEIVDRFFRPTRGGHLQDIAVRNIAFGTWCGVTGAVEEVVVVRLDETRVEVHCHGGAAASQAILESLASLGAAVESSCDWVRDQSTDCIQQEAWLALADARTARAAGILLDQYRGTLAATLRDLCRCLDTSASGTPSPLERIDQLLDWEPLGQHLTVPWRVVLAGIPNVGKSSLINALLGYERSIVFEQPGTTRDLLTASTALDGWSVELVDTAGCRETDDALEREGNRRARHQLSQADLAVIVVDPLTLSLDLTAALRTAARSSMVVVNKIDVCPTDLTLPGDWLRTSATTGSGVEQLGEAIAYRLVPSVPAQGAAVPFTSRQFHLLGESRDALRRGSVDSARKALAGIIGGST